MPVSVRVARAFHWRVGRNRSRSKVLLIHRCRDRNIRLVRRNLDRRNPVRERCIRIVREERLDRLRQIAAIHRCRGRRVHGKIGCRRIHAMMEDRCRRKDIRQERVAPVHRESDLRLRRRARCIRHDDLGRVRSLTANQRARDLSRRRIQRQSFRQRRIVAAIVDRESVRWIPTGCGDGAARVSRVLRAARAACHRNR